MDAGAPEFATVKIGGVVIPDNSNIMCAQSPPLAGNERRGDLAAGHDLGAEHFDLGTEGRELRELEDCVGGIFADPQNIETWRAHKLVVQGIGRAEKIKAS
jgi:hypothetical protein